MKEASETSNGRAIVTRLKAMKRKTVIKRPMKSDAPRARFRKSFRKLKAVHPGAVLLHEYLEPLASSPSKLAKSLGVTVVHVREIVRGRRSVSAEMALRLSRYFGTTPQLWQNLQSQYDLEVAVGKLGKQLQRRISPLPHLASSGSQPDIVLCKLDARLMLRLLRHPPPPNRRLRAALKRHSDLFGNDG
jgi:antitoxin HigA-1